MAGLAQQAGPDLFGGEGPAADVARHHRVGPHGRVSREVLNAMAAQAEAGDFEWGDGRAGQLLPRWHWQGAAAFGWRANVLQKLEPLTDAAAG